jgi:hypothetical protein
MHSIWSKCIKTRTQQQKQQKKTYKQLEVEQHIAQWSMGHWWNEEEIKRFLEVNENENRTYQNIWDKAKAFLRGKFIAMSTYIKVTERS